MPIKLNAGTIMAHVHCHVCPMKDVCKFGCPHDSFQFHNHAEEGYWSLENLSMATVNCPIKKLIQNV